MYILYIHTYFGALIDNWQYFKKRIRLHPKQWMYLDELDTKHHFLCLPSGYIKIGIEAMAHLKYWIYP